MVCKLQGSWSSYAHAKFYKFVRMLATSNLCLSYINRHYCLTFSYLLFDQWFLFNIIQLTKTRFIFRDNDGHKPQNDPFGSNAFGMNPGRGNNGFDDFINSNGGMQESVYIGNKSAQEQFKFVCSCGAVFTDQAGVHNHSFECVNMQQEGFASFAQGLNSLVSPMSI